MGYTCHLHYTNIDLNLGWGFLFLSSFFMLSMLEMHVGMRCMAQSVKAQLSLWSEGHGFKSRHCVKFKKIHWTWAILRKRNPTYLQMALSTHWHPAVINSCEENVTSQCALFNQLQNVQFVTVGSFTMISWVIIVRCEKHTLKKDSKPPLPTVHLYLLFL